MKRTLALISALCCLCILLAGCNLIKVNTTEVAKDEFAELKKEYDTVLAEYDGGTVTRFDIMNSLNYSAQMYYYIYGTTMPSSELSSYVSSAVDTEVSARAVQLQFEKRGLELDESEEEIRSEADAEWQEAYDYYYSIAEGETHEEKAIRTEMELYGIGYSKERLYRGELVGHQQPVLQDSVEQEIESVTDEQLQEAYEAKVSEDEASYTSSPSSIEQNATNANTIICWYPEGYRTVKHILIKPDEEALKAVTDARDAYNTAVSEIAKLNEELAQEDDEAEAAERSADDISADIAARESELPELEAAVAQAEQACIDSAKDRIDEVYAALESGTSFDQVMEEYGEDPGMQSEPAKTTGYYVAEGSTTWDSNFTEGAMALAQAGDYSAAPVISSSGIHIIYYQSDVQSGPVALEDVHDALYDATLDDMRAQHYQESLESWIKDMNVEYHLDRWTVGK